MTITNPAVAAAHVALEIAEGDQNGTPIIILESDYSGEASARDAVEHALEALSAHDGKPVRLGISARCHLGNTHTATDDLVLPGIGAYVTVVVALTVSGFTFDHIETGFVLRDIRRAIADREEVVDRYVHRVIYVISQEAWGRP